MRAWARWIGRLALTVGVTWVIVRQVGFTLDEALSLETAFPRVSLGVLSLSTVLLLAGFLTGARLWGKMAAELGGGDPGFLASWRIFLSANLGRYLPGKVWSVAGLAVLARRAGVSGTVAAAAGILAQTFTLVAAALLALPVISGPGGGFIVAAAVTAAVLIVCLAVPTLLRKALALAFRISGMPVEAAPEITRSFGPRWILWYVSNWVVYGAAFYAFVHALGFGAGPVPVVSAFALAYLLGYLAVFAPAGLGVREGVLIALLEGELGGAAVGVAVLARLWMTGVELLPAGAMALWEVLRDRTAPERRDGRGHRAAEARDGEG